MFRKKISKTKSSATQNTKSFQGLIVAGHPDSGFHIYLATLEVWVLQPDGGVLLLQVALELLLLAEALAVGQGVGAVVGRPVSPPAPELLHLLLVVDLFNN